MTNTEVTKIFGAENLTVEEADIFRPASATSVKQIIRNLAVDLALEQACRSGHLNMEYGYRKNKAANCSHIELFHGGKTLTHSAVGNNILPRRAIFRTEYANTNQISFDDLEGKRTIEEPKYGIITHCLHAGTDFCSVCLVIPDIDYGHACNQIPLNEIAPHLVISNSNITTDYEDFGFQLRRKIAEQSK